MKCLVLAGGKGDRLWPLSRQHYPKQFIKLQKNHSLFQETIARNIPFCDEFIIVTNEEYQFIIEDQMKSFQDITYRCVYEGVGRKTTAAIMLPIMQLAMSELVFVVGADQLVVGEDYKDAVMQAKELARMGYLVTIGMDFEKPQQRFGYIRYEGQDVLDFTEKPDEKTLGNFENTDYLVNTGMFLFQVGDILKQLVEYEPGVYQSLYQTYQARKSRKGALYFSKE
ncbi:MAG: sugar phosphate nucleotidyltransferase, partial [Lachnospiraceae bacterium]|nr:sugar phosphate nucleotidyltransferase [Lachnospiraceae bacterium]